MLDRIKTHVNNNREVYLLGAGVVVGATCVTAGVLLRRNVVTGDVWLSPRMLEQLKKHGGGMFQIDETKQLFDIIDWEHPTNAKLAAA